MPPTAGPSSIVPPSEPGGGTIDEGPAVGGIGQVAALERGPAADGLDRLDDRPAPILGPATDDHRGAECGELEGDALADARGRTGDERGAAGQIEGRG